jgi:twitching motility protein PilI
VDNPILAPHLNQVDRTVGDTYLKFQLEQQIPVTLSMEQAQEVLIVPTGRITPMPNMPECVLGLLNRRNRVLWVIDLAQMLQLQPLDTNVQQYHIVIIRVGQVPLGLVVQEVKGVTRFTLDCIQSPMGLVTSGLTPYVRGCILQQKEVILVLDAEAIVHSPILHSDYI